VASGSFDKTVKVWNSNTGALVNTLLGHTDVIRSVAFSSGGTLASGSDDESVRIWDPVSGGLVKTLRGHGDYVSAVAYDGGSSLLASASFDNTIKLWKN
jgi:WD40 repeat protein